MKSSEWLNVYVSVDTDAGHRFLMYSPAYQSYLGTGTYIHHGLGPGADDGKWHTFTRDLQADLSAAQSGVLILEVNGFYIRGSGFVDDIILRHN